MFKDYFDATLTISPWQNRTALVGFAFKSPFSLSLGTSSLFGVRDCGPASSFNNFEEL